MDSYHREKTVDNEEFYEIADFAVETILKQEIKAIRFGSHYQYMTYTGKIRAYMSQRKRRNSKSLILKGENFEIECSPNDWDEIKLEKSKIKIENVGLYIEFKKPIPLFKKKEVQSG